jgi:F-type H+-transporting ATPase subunit alpha
MIIFSNKVYGLVLNLELQKVSAVVLGKDSSILPGDLVSRSFRLINISVGDAILGKVVDPLGNVLTSLSEFKKFNNINFKETLDR